MTGSQTRSPSSNPFLYRGERSARVAAPSSQLVEPIKHRLGSEIGYSSDVDGWRDDIVVERWTLPPANWPVGALQKHRLAVFLGLHPVRASATVDGRTVAGMVQAGHVRVIPHGVPARSSWSSHLDLAVFEFSSTLIDRLLEGNAPKASEQLAPIAYASDPVAHDLTRRIVTELMTPTDRLYAESLCLIAATHVIRQYGTRHPESFRLKGGLSSNQAQHVLDYIHSFLEEPLSVSMLARVAGLSDGYFIRAFRQTFDDPPHRLILRLRLERAARLVLTKRLSLAEAAVAAGFYDQAHMTNAMRRHFGATPGLLLKR